MAACVKCHRKAVSGEKYCVKHRQAILDAIHEDYVARCETVDVKRDRENRCQLRPIPLVRALEEVERINSLH